MLVLSEAAGCAASLPGALLINPFAPPAVARALAVGLALSPAQRQARWAENHAYVTTHSAERWGGSFLEALRGGGGGAV